MELFKELVGGEQNLPPKLPKPEPGAQQGTKSSREEASDMLDAFGNLQVYDEFLAKQPAVGEPVPPRAQQRTTKPKAASHNPGSTGHTVQDEDETGWEMDPRAGELSDVGTTFVPWLAAAKFPYKFIDETYRERVDTFFAGGKLYLRGWDL